MTYRPTYVLEKSASSGSRARAGRLMTAHGEALTPLFMPVGTHATVRGMKVEELSALGAKVLLANTYHLLLRPGPEVFERMGGIHKFMRWDGAVLTDSGGFQIFSMPGSRRITEDGAVFKSYVDGEMKLLSPEASINTQLSIGSDIMMVLDVCVPSTVDRPVAREALDRTNRWALRSLAARGERPGGMFAIVQGACFADLRKESADFITQHPFDGFAIGGLAVGETKAEREDFTELTTELLPRDKPRYLMGVGTPIDLLEAVHRGVDMFDCIIPQAHGQHGTAFTFDGLVRLRRTANRFVDAPIDPRCTCYACRHYTRAYIHHLIKAGEGLGWHLIATHNFHFYQDLTRDMRRHILADTFPERYRHLRETLALSDAGEASPTRVRAPRLALTRGRYEVRVGASGVAHIVQSDSGEAMHPTAEPDREAHELYVETSTLLEKSKIRTDVPLVIWDVGLGAGHNAMAAVRALEALAADGELARPVELVSFENDLDSLVLARKHVGRFTHLRHGAPQAIIDRGSWSSPKAPLTWRLLEGDFLERLADAPPPDVVFYDPFSYKTDTPLWSAAAFAKVHAATCGRATELLTYSTSTAVRSAMLAAGFFVAKAPGVGSREECTVALTKAAVDARGAAVTPRSPELLGTGWLARWERSGARHPVDTALEAAPEIEARIRNHQQFS